MISNDVTSRIAEFDSQHEAALRRIWFLGDVHGQFKYLARALVVASAPPAWLVFLGDVDIDHKPLRELLDPMYRDYPQLRVAFIHGNHDADTYEHWKMLHDAGNAIALHGRVVELNGVRVAGLGGVFLGQVWMPPGEAIVANKAEAIARGTFQWRGGQRPAPKYLGAIYQDEFEALATQEADILVTHEAPSCHPHGNPAIDELARCLKVTRSFHGHHHDDLSDEYAKVRVALGFDARAVDYCGIKNGLGQVVLRGEAGW
ncbi:metallophosphoesterase [Caenimonas sp. S4]|nr:metallophosphoesterase [Caenimonas soli]